MFTFRQEVFKKKKEMHNYMIEMLFYKQYMLQNSFKNQSVEVYPSVIKVLPQTS